MASLASPSSTDSSGDSGVCLVTTTATATATTITTQQQGEEEVQRQVRFQCQPTKCLEYARDKTGAEVKEQEAAGEEARRLPSVTFAEAECDVREFVTDKDLVSIIPVLSNVQYPHYSCYPSSIPSSAAKYGAKIIVLRPQF